MRTGNQKKRSIRFLLLVVLSALLLSGVALAYMFHKADLEETAFTPAIVTCEVAEEFDGTSKTSIRVENTGNIPADIRVRLVSYWEDGDGNIVGRPSKMPEVSLADGWTEVEGEADTYWYQMPVDPQEFTGELLKAPIELETMTDGDGRTLYQVIEVFADAIQSSPKLKN